MHRYTTDCEYCIGSLQGTCVVCFHSLCRRNLLRSRSMKVARVATLYFYQYPVRQSHPLVKSPRYAGVSVYPPWVETCTLGIDASRASAVGIFFTQGIRTDAARYCQNVGRLVVSASRYCNLTIQIVYPILCNRILLESLLCKRLTRIP